MCCLQNIQLRFCAWNGNFVTIATNQLHLDFNWTTRQNKQTITTKRWLFSREVLSLNIGQTARKCLLNSLPTGGGTRPKVLEIVFNSFEKWVALCQCFAESKDRIFMCFYFEASEPCRELIFSSIAWNLVAMCLII